jgi:hypothetical protein
MWNKPSARIAGRWVLASVLALLAVGLGLAQETEAQIAPMFTALPDAIAKDGQVWLSLDAMRTGVAGLGGDALESAVRVTGVAVSPRGDAVAVSVRAASADWLVIVDSATKGVLDVHRVHGGGIQGLAWAPSGQYLALMTSEANGLPGIRIVRLADRQVLTLVLLCQFVDSATSDLI